MSKIRQTRQTFSSLLDGDKPETSIEDVSSFMLRNISTDHTLQALTDTGVHSNVVATLSEQLDYCAMSVASLGLAHSGLCNTKPAQSAVSLCLFAGLTV